MWGRPNDVMVSRRIPKCWPLRVATCSVSFGDSYASQSRPMIREPTAAWSVDASSKPTELRTPGRNSR